MQHSRAFVVLTLVFAGFLLASLSGVAEEQTVSPVRHPGPIEQLLKERRGLLDEVVRFRVQQHSDGTIDFGAVILAKQELTAADLELAKTAAQRISVLEQQLDLYKQVVLLAESRFRVAGVTRVDVLKAKASRIYAEIELLRARDQVKP